MHSATAATVRHPVGRWVLLMPLTYVCHIAEEYWAGESFYRWVARLGWTLSDERFLVLNAVALAVMTGALLLSLRVRRAAVAVPAFSSAILLNAGLHIAASVLTASYSPGLITGVVLWIPLGGYMLQRSWTSLPHRQMSIGIALGICAHGLVTGLAMAGGWSG